MTVSVADTGIRRGGGGGGGRCQTPFPLSSQFLGYGAVAVPALFVALCLKFDLKMHRNRKLKLYHMVGCVGEHLVYLVQLYVLIGGNAGYIIGLAVTCL